MEQSNDPIKKAINDLMLKSIVDAYGKLPERECVALDEILNNLTSKMRTKKTLYGSKLPTMFGFTSAMELVAKLGIFLNEEEKKGNFYVREDKNQ